MKEKTNLIGQATPEQIEAWKKKHGKVFGIVVDGHIAYLRKPTRPELSYAATVSQNNMLKSNEVLMKAMWLGGSEAIQTEDELFFGASAKLADIIQVKEAELVNL